MVTRFEQERRNERAAQHERAQAIARQQRENHRQEYARLLGRLVKALELPPAERAKWRAQIDDIAMRCNDHRARYLWVTEAVADRRHGTVLEVAQGIVDARALDTSGMSDVDVLLALGATFVEEVSL